MNKTESKPSWSIVPNSGDRHEDGSCIALAVITRMEMLERGWGPEGGQVYTDGWEAGGVMDHSMEDWQGGGPRRMGAQMRKGEKCDIPGRVRNTTRGTETWAWMLSAGGWEGRGGSGQGCQEAPGGSCQEG